MIEKTSSTFLDVYQEEENEEFIWNFLSRINHSYFVVFLYREYLIKTLEYYKNAPNIPNLFDKKIYDRLDEISSSNLEEHKEQKWSSFAISGPLKESIFLDENHQKELIEKTTKSILQGE